MHHKLPTRFMIFKIFRVEVKLFNLNREIGLGIHVNTMPCALTIKLIFGWFCITYWPDMEKIMNVGQTRNPK